MLRKNLKKSAIFVYTFFREIKINSVNSSNKCKIVNMPGLREVRDALLPFLFWLPPFWTTTWKWPKWSSRLKQTTSKRGVFPVTHAQTRKNQPLAAESGSKVALRKVPTLFNSRLSITRTNFISPCTCSSYRESTVVAKVTKKYWKCHFERIL